jgi:argininosuccinate synthase
VFSFMNDGIKKVVLAYSGGLDTSIIIPWLKENYGCEVIAMVGDVGQGDDFNQVEAKAYKSGASKVYIEDLKKEFVTGYIFPTLKAGAVYEGKYLLGTSMARPPIAKRQVEIALAEGADAVAHGATGKGNDQVRFEMTYKALAPELKVIAPWREWSIKSRNEAIDYAQQHGIPIPVTKEKPYSMDKNLWHTSYEGGILEDPWNEPNGDMFQLTVDPASAPDEPEVIQIDFEQGVPVAIDNRNLGPVELLEKLNQLAGRHGVGRADIVENRLVGMKSRGVYETPGGTVLITAVKELASLCLDRDTQHFKEIIAHRYAELVYFGQWFSPLKEGLDAFINKISENLTGSVKVKLFKGQIYIAGRKSPYSLYREDMATFGEDVVYNQKDAAGFINLFGLSTAIGAKLKQMTDSRKEGEPSEAVGRSL